MNISNTKKLISEESDVIVVYEDECKKVGVDPKRLERIANRIAKAVREVDEMGVQIFGGTGSGDLRYHDHDESDRPLILAHLGGINWSGGDGACMEDSKGLMRGE